MDTVDKKEYRIHELFEVSIVLKGLNALVELIAGALLLIFPNIALFVQALVANELVEDPNSFLANHLQGVTNGFSPDVQLYSSLYLLSHGVIKAVLVVGLLRNKLWSYPASLAVLSLFIAYQAIKFIESHSIALVLLTLFDFVVMWLIWHEYRQIQKKQL